MKKGTKKFTATSSNFNMLQSLRGEISSIFEVENIKWGGNWNGINWENFSFYATVSTVEKIKYFCKINDLEIEII